MLMLGALGGVTIAAMVMQIRGFNTAALVMWLLFTGAAGVHVYVL
jgi:hypothetical protein